MPTAVTYALAYIASSAGWAVGSTLLTAAGYVITIGGSIAIGNAQRRKAMRRARDAYNASLQDRLVMTATVDAARSRVYGRVRTVDGVLFKATRGANSEFYTLVIAVAGHEVDAIEDVYFNDLKVTLDGSGYVQTAPYYQTTRKSAAANMTVSSGTGSVVLPFTPVAGSVSVTFTYPSDGGHDVLSFTVTGNTVSLSGVSSGYNGTAVVEYQYDEGKSYARVRKYLGAPGQDLSTVLQPLFPSLVTSADKFQGIALLLVDLEYSQDAYPTGVPNISAVVRGAKCYDPRTTTTAWTQNPAIISRDWSLYAYGGGCTSAQIDDAMVIAAANACDVDTTFVRPSGNVTLDTYQAGIVCRLDADPTQALDEMVESMAGRWGWAGGVLQLVAGVYRAPVATITEDWIADASEISIVPQPPRSELVNSYTPTISNRENDYVVEPAPRIAPSSYITADGREYPREVQMSAVTHPAHAQHICGVMLRDGRQSLTVELPCKLHAWQLELFDTVSVTLPHFGWSGKTFEVVGWRFAIGSGVVLTLKETAASVYDPDAGFGDLGNDDNTDLPLPWEVPPAIAGLTVTSGATTQVDGSILTRTKVSWSAVAEAAVTQAGKIEVQYLEVGAPVPAGDWPGQSEAGSATETTIVGLRSGRVYVVRARAVSSLGVRGPWTTQIAHQVALPPQLAYGNVSGRPKLFRAVARGNNDTQTPISAGLYDGETGQQLSGVARSYIVNVIRRSDGVVISSTTYDVYASTANASAMASALNALDSTVVVVVRTFDEPQTNRLTGGLDTAMYRCGASRAVFGSPLFRFRSAYVLVGIPGCGEGQGAESYNGAIDSDTNAWTDLSFMLAVGGALVVTGTSATPRTLRDYNYDGDLSATRDLTLVNHGSALTIQGNRVVKETGVAAWDAALYSQERFRGPVLVSFVPERNDRALMIGLDNDPGGGIDYIYGDYFLYCAADGNVYVYENGTGTASLGTYAAGDSMAVAYDGLKVRYYRNGALLREVTAGIGLALSLDGVFREVGAAARNIRYSSMQTVAVAGSNIIDSNGRITSDNRLLGNLIDATTWEIGASGTQPGFVHIGGVGENSIVLDYAPDGVLRPVWQANSDGGNDASGGWNTTDVKIDPTRMYRSTVWFKSLETGAGYIYHGCGENKVRDIATGNLNSSPYWTASTKASFIAGRWYLAVGYIFPSAHGTTQYQMSGIYDGVTGEKVASHDDFKWDSAATSNRQRVYQYYATTSGYKVRFVWPRFEMCDGSELQLKELLNLVGTQQIGENAATVPLVEFDASYLIFQNVVGSYDGTIHTLSWTNNTGKAVTVQIEQHAKSDPYSGASGVQQLEKSVTISGGGGATVDVILDASPSTAVEATIVDAATVPAGETITVTLDYYYTVSTVPPNFSWQLYNLITRVTAILR